MTRTLISMLIAAVVVGLCSGTHVQTGGFRLIDNVNDPHIQELGRWAVSEHVKQASDGLVFGKVVSGRQQVVAGMKYVLFIQATKGGAGKFSSTYEAVVWEMADHVHTRQLLSFNQAK